MSLNTFYSKKTTIIFISFTLVFLFLSSGIIQAQQAGTTENNWDKDSISELMARNIITPYSNNDFDQEEPITRGEFSIILAQQLHLPPENQTYFSDLDHYENSKYINALIEKDIISGYPDNTFRPDETITRAETISILIKALGILDDEEKINLEEKNVFADISREHWASEEIIIAHKLGFLDYISGDNLNPDSLTTREETANFLYHLSRLSSYKGYLADVYPTSQRISFNTNQGQRKIFSFNSNSLIGRNNRLVELDEIQLTDETFLITDSEENIIYLKAYGMITTEDLSTEVSRMTNGLLQPQEVETLAGGHYDFLGPKLETSVRNTLINQGFTAAEVNAIMNTEWNKLETLSRDRLTEAVAIHTGLPLEITRSLFDRDWEKIKNYGQIELFQRIVQEILSGDLIS